MTNARKLAYTFGVEQALQDFEKLSQVPGAAIMEALRNVKAPSMAARAGQALSGVGHSLQEGGEGVLDYFKHNLSLGGMKQNASEAAEAAGGYLGSASKLRGVNKELGAIPGGLAQGSVKANNLRELAEAITEMKGVHADRGMEAMKGLAAPVGVAALGGAAGYGAYKGLGGGSDE